MAKSGNSKRRTNAAWDGLKPATRRRYERNGVTRASYVRGDSLSAARGHARTPERPERAAKHPERYTAYLNRGWNARARSLGIGTVWPWWVRLPPAEREFMAEAYVLGWMTPGRATESGIAMRQVALDVMPDMRRIATDGEDDEGMTADEWKDYRNRYRSQFGA